MSVKGADRGKLNRRRKRLLPIDDRSRPLQFEALESRFLLSFTPLGGVHINPFNHQYSTPVLAMDGAGDLIVAFTFADGFIAQRYNVANESLGPQILINTNGTGAEFPSVTMDNAGDFLIAGVGPTAFSSNDTTPRVRRWT